MAYINPYERDRQARERAAGERSLAEIYGVGGQGETPASTPSDMKEVNVFRRAWDTVEDLEQNIINGAIGSVEGVADFALGAVGAVGGIFSDRFRDLMKKAIQYDVTKNVFEATQNKIHRAITGSDLGEHSYLADDSMVNNVARGIGGMLPAVAVSAATFGAAAPAAAGGTAAASGTTAASAAKAAQMASMATMATGAAGQASQEAYEDGAGFYGGQAYGLLRGTTELATEYALGGTTKLITGGGMLPGVRKSVASVGAKRVVKAALEEGAEEMISEGLDPATRTVYKGKEALAEYANPAFYRRVIQAGRDGTLTGLAFQGTVGHAMGNTGKAADIQEIAQELDTLAEKRRNLHKNNRLTDEADAAIGEAERENWRVAESVLKKATPEKRAALMADYGLSGKFSEDGSMTAEFSAELDRHAMVRKGGFDRRTTSMNADVEKVSEALGREGRTQFTDVDSLSKDGRENLKKVKRVMNVLSDLSGGEVGNFVIASESVEDNGYYDPGTGYVVLGADVLEQGIDSTAKKGMQSWFGTILHETAHGTENTDAWVAMTAKLREIDGGRYYAETLKELGNRGYLNGKAADIRAEFEKILRKMEKGEKLTAKQEAFADTFISESGSIMAELALGNKHFARALLDADASVVEKILHKIEDAKEALSRRKDPEAKKVFEEIKAAEGLFLEAVAESGLVYRDGKIVGASEEEDEVKKSQKTRTADFTEYDKPITLQDIEVLRSIGRKSINAFTSADIEKAQKWAYKFYKEMGTKSPFFRAWFGDWRAYDTKTKIPIVPVNAETIERGDVPRGDFNNEDTGWSITSNSDGIDETANKEQKRSDSYHALKDIDELLKNAVLLDTIVVTDPSKRIGKNAALMHHLYCPISVNGEVGVAKLYIAESLGDKHKFYLMRIEKASTAMGFNTEDGESTPHSNAATDDATVSIAQIFEFVKEHNENFEKNSDYYVPFEPKTVNELMLDDNKEPRVLYHGTNADFTAFDYSHVGESTGVGILGDGFYFTDKKELAVQYGKKIMACYVRMEKPYIASYDDAYGLSTAELEKQGFDGVIFETPSGTLYMAFDGSQIKSATDNIGTFDGRRGDIRHSRKANSQTSGKAAAIDPAKRKAIANLMHQKVYNKADAANIMNSFIVEDTDTQSKGRDIQRFERELKGKVIDFIWDRLNAAVSKDKQGIEAFAMAEKIVIYRHRNDLMQDTDFSAEQLFETDLSIHEFSEEKLEIAKLIEKAYNDYGKESRRAKQDQKVEQLKKKYTDPITRNDRTNTIVKLAMDLFNWKNEVFFNHTNISDVDLFRRTLGKLTGTRYHGYFNEEGARKCIEEYGKWYLSDATEKILGKGESWSVYSEEIAEKIRTVSNGKGDLTTDDLDDIIDILQDARSVSEAYGTVFRNGKRVKAIDVAKEEAATVTANANIKMGFMDWLFRRYGAEFGEPGSLFRYIDRHRPGFLTEFFERFRKDSIQAQKHEYEMISLLDEVLRNKKYRGYLKDAHKRTVEYRDGTGTTYHIPTDIATALYMSLMAPANAGMLAPSGFAYKDPKTGKTIRPKGFMIGFDPYEIDPDTKRVRVKQEVIEAAEEQAAKLYEQFTEADMEYISAVEAAFEKCGELKSQTDIARRGWTNTMKGYYFPAKTAFTAKQLGDYRVEIQSVAQESFNKNRTEGNQHELWFDSLDTIARSHIHGVSVYAALGQSIDDFELLYHMDVSGNPNKPISIRTELSEIWPGGKDAMEKFIDAWKKDVQGISDKETSDWAKTFEKIRGNVAVAAITGNLKVLLSQVSSYFAAANVIEGGSLFKALSLRSGKDVDEYSTLAMLRHENNEAALAQGVLDKLDGAHDFLSKPIGWTDRLVVKRIFAACQYQIAKDQKLELGTEENKKAAGELLERVILETQQNALATEKSAAMRSKNPILRTFVMFSADGMKQMARFLDGVGEMATIKAEAEFFKRDVDKTKMNAARKKTARAAAVMAVQAVYMVAIAQLIQWALKKDEEREPEEIAKDLAVDFFGGILGGLPVIRDIYDGITQGYGTEDMSISAFNDMVSSVKNLLDMAKDIASGEFTGRNAAWKIRKAVYAIGNVAGIPVRNIDKYADGLIRWVAPDAAYKKDNAFSVQPFRSDIAKAIEQGDEGRLETVIGVMLDTNVGEVTSQTVRQEMKRLVSNGMDVLPRGVGDTVTVDGDTVKLTEKQKRAFRAVYSEANKSVEKMVGLAYYADASDEAKAKAIKRVYGIYYNRAIEDLLGVELENRNTLLSRAIDPEVLAIVLAVCGEMQADIGKDGKPVANSKRKKVEEYVDSLKLRAAQKYMIMGALGYKNTKGKEKVEAYVRGLGLTTSEREAIMEYSGY